MMREIMPQQDALSARQGKQAKKGEEAQKIREALGGSAARGRGRSCEFNPPPSPIHNIRARTQAR